MIERKELVTVDLIRKAARETLGPLSKMLAALRSKKPHLISQWPDLMAVDPLKQYDTKYKAIVNALAEATEPADKSDHEDETLEDMRDEVKKEILIDLYDHDIKTSIADDVATKIIKGIDPLNTNLSALKKQAVKLALAKEETKTKPVTPPASDRKALLCRLAEAAKKTTESVHDVLLRTGHIEDIATEFVDKETQAAVPIQKMKLVSTSGHAGP